jgi:hypothetical protein
MARLYLFAEGQTEQTFADTVLKPHLANTGVYLQNSVLISKGRKKGRGGGRKYLTVKNDIMRFLSQERDGDVFFTTMIDLYAIHADFPKLSEGEKLRHMPEKRVGFLEQAFADDMGDQRFVPYIQLHEYEAYLFSDPSHFRHFYGRHERQIAALQKIADSYPTPELINDGQDTAPSKRIIAELHDYKGAKSVFGPEIAQLIGLDVIRSKCPHFNDWLSQLEKLSERA